MIGNIRLANKVQRLVFCVSLSLVLTGCETDEQVAEGHLEKGIELLKKGDYAAAQLELKSAKQGNKSTAETYYYLALLDEKAKHYLAMQNNLLQTLKLEPTHQQARVKLGKLELLMGKVDKAKEHVEILLTKNAQDKEALVLKASILIREGQQKEALTIVKHVLDADPLSIDGLSLKAMLLAQEDKLDEALIVINKAINADEKNAALHFFKIRIHGKQKDADAIISDYLVLCTLFPDNDNYKITLAQIYTQSKKLTEAEKLLRDFVLAKPSQIKPKVLLLEFLTATAEDRVNQQIKLFTKQLSGQPRQLLNLSKWMLAKGNEAGAKETLTQVSTGQGYSKTGIEAKILLAKIAFDTRDYPATKKIAEEILQNEPNQLDAKLLQARLLLIEEQYVQAKAYLDKIIWSHPKSDKALVLLAQLYLVQGEQEKSQVSFKDALKHNPANIAAFIPVFNHLMAKDDIKYARQLLDKALRKKPKQAVLLQKLIQLNMLEEKWQAATQVVMQLGRIPKQKNQAKLYLASISQGQGEFEKAISIYKELIDEFPDQLRVLQQMKACYDSLGKLSEMRDYLNEQLQKNKDNISVSVVLTDLFIAEKKPESAIRLLNKLIKKHPKSILLTQKLANIYISQKKLNKAISVYQQSLVIFPGNIRMSLSVASLFEQQKRFDKAVKIYEQLHAKNPGLAVVNNNLAVLLVENFATEDNLTRALQLVESFATSKQDYYQDSYAWVILHRGRITEALGVFNKLIVKAPDVPVFRYHLGVAEYKDGNNSTALVQIDQALELSKQGRDFPELKVAEKLKAEIIAKIQGR